MRLKWIIKEGDTVAKGLTFERSEKKYLLTTAQYEALREVLDENPAFAYLMGSKNKRIFGMRNNNSTKGDRDRK